MPCRAWQFVAALGLALALASSGQAQEEAPGGQGEPPAQEQPAPTLPIPLPVDIVEDEADAEARERSEREARQREIDALIAQQGMNDATRAMNDATQRMAKYALYSTLLVGVGTVLLIGTLWLTRQANRAAQTGVTVTEAAYKMDQRPWLAIGNPTVAATRVGPLHLGSNVEALWLHYDLTVTNTGKTPAQDARLLTLVGRRNTEEWNTEVKAMDAILPKPGAIGFSIAPSETRTLPLIACIPFAPSEVPDAQSEMIWGYFVLGYGVAGDDVRKSTKVGFLLEVLRNAVDARSQPYWIGHAPDPDDARAHPVPPPEALAFSRISAVMT